MPGQGWTYNESCFDAENRGRSSEDAENPPVGEVFYYLVSARNSCGESAAGGTVAGEPVFASAPCPSVARDTDGDGIRDWSDDCAEVANPTRRTRTGTGWGTRATCARDFRTRTRRTRTGTVAGTRATTATSRRTRARRTGTGTGSGTRATTARRRERRTRRTADGDGAGDACDADDDNDGFADGRTTAGRWRTRTRRTGTADGLGRRVRQLRLRVERRARRTGTGTVRETSATTA